MSLTSAASTTVINHEDITEEECSTVLWPLFLYDNVFISKIMNHSKEGNARQPVFE